MVNAKNTKNTTMKTKHTPGPWAYDQLRNKIYSTTEWFIEPNKNDDEEGQPVDVISTLGAMGGEDVSADIKLIVAAPELLEVLKELIANCKISNNTVLALVKKSKEIIKKAEGEI